MKKLVLMAMLLLTMSGQAHAALIINEFLADPPSGLTGDANGDRIRHSAQDEFVEILNLGTSSVNLSNWTLSDKTSVRHIFAIGSSLGAHKRAVIFGGGTPTRIPGLVFTASTGSLSLNNSGDELLLKNHLDQIIDLVSFSNEASQDQSLTRLAEGTGAFQLHKEVSSESLLFSPGTDVNGKLREEPISTPEPLSFALFSLGLLIKKFMENKQVESF